MGTTSPTVGAVGVCDTLSTNERYHLCGHMENGELVGHGWQGTTASKLLSTDLSTSEKFAECQLFCESQATDGCCEFRDQAKPWCLFKESGIPREQTSRTPGGSETYSVSCVRQDNTASTASPSRSPSDSPSVSAPTEVPSRSPSEFPSKSPTSSPSASMPTVLPSDSPSVSAPTGVPSQSPSASAPTTNPSKSPSKAPSSAPSVAPTTSPSKSPS